VPLPAGPGLIPLAEDAAKLITERTRAIVLVSPNNPGGSEYPAETLTAFHALARRHGLALIVDETYRDFDSRSGRPHDLFTDPDWARDFIHLYSFSKTYRLTGHRVGAVVAGTDRLAEIEREAGQQRFGDFVTAQAKAAEAARTRAAQDVREVVEANDKKIKATRDYQEQLAKIARAEAAGVTTLPGGAAFDATKARTDALREYQDKLAKANEEGQKAAKLADDQAAKVAKVSEALAIELDRQTRLAEAQRFGRDAVEALNTEMEVERQLAAAPAGPADKPERVGKKIEAERRAVDADASLNDELNREAAENVRH
jgi:aspartate/methionine/tyrosine aminotransferase